MRIMLEVCRSFAVSHKLEFNASKTQLICFYAPSVAPVTPFIYFNSTLLSYSNQVVHLGHILTNNLNDTMDIMRVVKDLNRKANFVLCTFHAADPFVKTFLLQSYCLSLYGCCLWSLNSPSINLIEIALNKILRKIWHLPPCSHTAIVHCVAQVDTISNLLNSLFSQDPFPPHPLSLRQFLTNHLTVYAHLLVIIILQYLIMQIFVSLVLSG